MCTFTKIVEIKLFRMHTDPNVPLPDLGIDETVLVRVDRRKCGADRTLLITQRYGEGLLPIVVREFDKSTINFDELPDDLKNVYDVPYQIVDLKKVKTDLVAFLANNIRSYIKEKVKPEDEITYWFFKLAWNLAFRRPKTVFMTLSTVDDD